MKKLMLFKGIYYSLIILFCFNETYSQFDFNRIEVHDEQQNNTSPYYDYGFNRYRLTARNRISKIALWNDITNNNSKIDLNKDFSIRFLGNFGKEDEGGADGIVFIIHNDSRTNSIGQSIALGAGGGQIGYLGTWGFDSWNSRIQPSFAVEFDTWLNYDFPQYSEHCFNDKSSIVLNNPPANQQTCIDHISFAEDGKQDCLKGANTEKIKVDANGVALDVEDGIDKCILITYTASTRICSVYVDGNFRKEYPLNIWINSHFPNNNNEKLVFWGFTSATDNGTNDQIIQFLNMKKGNNNFDVGIIVYQNGTVLSGQDVNDCKNYYYACANGNITITATPQMDNGVTVTDYTWYKNNVKINDNHTNTLLLQNVDKDLYINCIITFSDGTIITKTINLIITSFSFDLENFNTDCIPMFRPKTIITNGKTLINSSNLYLVGEKDNLNNPIYPDFITWDWTVSESNNTKDGDITQGNENYQKRYDYANGKKEMTAILTGTYHRYKYFYNDQSKTSDPTNDYYNCTFTKEFPVSWDFTVETEVLEDYCSSSNCPAKVKVKVKRNKFGTIEEIDPLNIQSYTWKDINNLIVLNKFSVNNAGNTDPNSTVFEYPGSGKYFLTIKFNNTPPFDGDEKCDIKGDVEIKEFSTNFFAEIKCDGNNSKLLYIYPEKPDNNYKFTISDGFTNKVIFSNKLKILQVPITNTTTITYNIKMELTDSKTCTGCYKDLTITDEIPEVKIDEIKLCNIPPYNFRINSSPFNLTKYTYFWDYSDGTPLTPGTLSDINIPNPVILNKPLPNKSLRLKVTDNSTGCIYYGTQNITLNSAPKVVAHNHYAVCIGESIQLRVKALDASGAPLDDTELNNYYFIWSPANSLNNPTLAEPTATPDVNTNYSVTIIDKITGCSKHIENILVEVIKPNEEYVKRVYNDKPDNFNSFNDFGLIIKMDSCKYIITNSHFDASCSYGLPVAPLLKYNVDGVSEWQKYYKISDINNEYAFHLDCIQSYDSLDSFFYKKIRFNENIISLGSYLEPDSNKQYNNYDIHKAFILKIKKDGSFTKYLRSNKENLFPKKIIQTTDGNYVTIMLKDTSINGESKNYTLITRFNNDLSCNWSKYLDDDISDKIVELNNKLYVLSYKNEKYFKLLKLNADGSIEWLKKIKIYNNDTDTLRALNIDKFFNNGELIITGNIHYDNPNKDIKPFYFTIDEDGNTIYPNTYYCNSNFYNSNGTNIYDKQKAIGSLFISKDRSNFSLIYKSNILNKIFTKKINTSLNNLCGNYDYELKGLGNSISPINKMGFLFGVNSICGTRDGSSFYFNRKNECLFGIFNNLNKSSCFDTVSGGITTLIISITGLNSPSQTSSFNFTNLTLSIYDKELENEDLCKSKPCYCDSTIINVDVNYIDNSTDPTKCCFNITLTPDQSKCSDITKFSIKDENNNELSQELFNSTNPVTKGICFDEFSGYKNITIEYLDGGNNIICSTTKQLKCKCDCEELKTMDSKVEIITKSVSATPNNTDECCFEISLKNTGNCNFRSKDIKIKYSNNMDQEDINMNLGNLSYQNINSELILNDINLILKPNQEVVIGLLCVKKSNKNKDFTIELISDNCDPKSYKFSISCDEDPKDCCDEISNITIIETSSSTDKKCCYNISFSAQNLCENISKIVIIPDNTNLFPVKIIDITNGYANIEFCVDKENIHSINPINVKIKFIGTKNNVVCEKPFTIPVSPCRQICCSNFNVTYKRLQTQQCCYEINLSPICINAYFSAEIKQYHYPNGIRTPFGSPMEILPRTDLYGNRIPIDFNNFVLTFCDIPTLQYTIEAEICFKDENGNIINNCCVQFDVQCEHPEGKIVQDYDNDNVITIKKSLNDLICIPNPVNDYFIISFNNNDIDFINCELINQNGNKIAKIIDNSKTKIGKNEYHFETTNLSNGIYFLRLIYKNEIYLLKIIIQK